MAACVSRIPLGGSGSSGGVLVLGRRPGARVRPAGEALATKRRAPAARAASSRMSSALRAQPVGGGERAVGLARVELADRGELVDDDVGAGGGDRGASPRRGRARRRRPARRRARAPRSGRERVVPVHVVAGRDERAGEGLAEGAGGACEEDVHDVDLRRDGPVVRDSRGLRALTARSRSAIAYRMLGSVTEAEDIVQEAFLRLHRDESRSSRRRRSSPPSPRGWRSTRCAPPSMRRETYPGPVAAGADGHRHAARPRVDQHGAAGRAGEPVARRARGVPAPRRVRLRLRRDRGDRRQEPRELPPARAARPPPRRRRPPPLRPLRRAARRRSSRASSTPSATATSTAWSRCSPRTRRSTATAAGRRRRAPRRCSGGEKIARFLLGLTPDRRARATYGSSRRSSTASRARSSARPDGAVTRRDVGRRRGRPRSPRSARS